MKVRTIRGSTVRRWALVTGVVAALLTATIPASSSVGSLPAPHDHADHHHGATSSIPSDRPARGLVYDGLSVPASGGPCETAAHGTLLEVRGRGGEVLGCTHGPDPAPAGVEVGELPSTQELRTTMATEQAAGTSCIGDGTSGYRVQAIYAHPADVASRYATVAPMIRSWAATNVEAVVAASAAQTGGARQVRFVTDPACQIVVDEVTLSPTGDDTFGNTINELADMGYVASDRKFLVWMDAPGPYCGIGQMYLDDRDAMDNYNNGRSSVRGMVARVDAPCWGSGSTPVEAHELVHTLGGVQSAAPNSSSRFPAPAGGHCTDEFDLMCYDDDGPGPATTTAVCPSSEERRLDCQDDDYFHTSPPAGSYLDTHWNTADSRFLETPVTLPTETAPPPGDETSRALTLVATRRRVPAGRRVKLIATSRACQGDGEIVTVTGRRKTYRELTNRDCVAEFQIRVRRKTAFQASTNPERAGGGTVTSNTVVVRVRRR